MLGSPSDEKRKIKKKGKMGGGKRGRGIANIRHHSFEGGGNLLSIREKKGERGVEKKREYIVKETVFAVLI